jgi:hypothetical protein
MHRRGRVLDGPAVRVAVGGDPSLPWSPLRVLGQARACPSNPDRSGPAAAANTQEPTPRMRRRAWHPQHAPTLGAVCAWPSQARPWSRSSRRPPPRPRRPRWELRAMSRGRAPPWRSAPWEATIPSPGRGATRSSQQPPRRLHLPQGPLHPAGHSGRSANRPHRHQQPRPDRRQLRRRRHDHARLRARPAGQLHEL